MVQVVKTARLPSTTTGSAHDDIGYPGWSPLIHIHHVERNVFGNGIAIHVYGEMRIAAKEVVYARELKLNTIQTLTLTAETRAHQSFNVQKWIDAKGEYDNYASIDIFDTADDSEQVAGQGPDEGSVWIDFEALGE